MEEMASNVKQNADNAAQTESIARMAAENAEKGGAIVNEAADAAKGKAPSSPTEGTPPRSRAIVPKGEDNSEATDADFEEF
jgi:hypothetical protein